MDSFASKAELSSSDRDLMSCTAEIIYYLAPEGKMCANSGFDDQGSSPKKVSFSLDLEEKLAVGGVPHRGRTRSGGPAVGSICVSKDLDRKVCLTRQCDGDSAPGQVTRGTKAISL